MFKKISLILAIMVLVLFSAAAKSDFTKGSFGFQAGAFAESNIMANSVGAEVEGYYMPWANWGFTLGVRGFGYFGFDDESTITPIKPMIMPYVAAKYRNFEFGGGAGFNLENLEGENGPQVTPYVRINWDIPFTSLHEGSNNRFSMTVGTHWYILMPYMENYQPENLGEGLAAVFIAILEAASNVIPKVNIGFTYQYDSIAPRAN